MDLLSLKDELRPITSIAYENPEEALRQIHAIQSKVKEYGEPTLDYEVRISIGVVYTICNRYEEAVILQLENYGLCKEIGYVSGMNRALNQLGYVYYRMGQMDRAKRVLLHFEKNMTQEASFIQKVALYNNLGEVFLNDQDYGAAMAHYNRALALCEQLDEKDIKSTILLNLGQLYYELGLVDEAVEYYLKSLEQAKTMNQNYVLLDVYGALGQCYFKLGNLDQLKLVFDKGNLVSEKLSDSFYLKRYKLNRVMYDLILDDVDRLELFYKLEEESLKDRDIEYLKMLYEYWSIHFENKGEFREALSYFKKHHMIEKQIESQLIVDKLNIIRHEVKYNLNFDKTDIYEEATLQQIESERRRNKQLKLENEKLLSKVDYDELTGQLNRRALNKYLSDYGQQDSSISVFLIDIDKFKLFNDTLGHLAGDDCLVQISHCINKIAKQKHDIFVRYGGEEFIYISRGKTPQQAQQLADEIRIAVQDMDIQYDAQGQRRYVTVSIGGVWAMPGTVADEKQLIHLADVEMYRAKQSGRNYSFVRIQQ